MLLSNQNHNHFEFPIHEPYFWILAKWKKCPVDNITSKYKDIFQNIKIYFKI